MSKKIKEGIDIEISGIFYDFFKELNKKIIKSKDDKRTADAIGINFCILLYELYGKNAKDFASKICEDLKNCDWKRIREKAEREVKNAKC
jgi:hypothetical protein